MKIKELSKIHYEWVERMGWHNKTILESLALIASEFGETAAECLAGKITEEFQEELADIFLRIADLSYEHNIDLEFHLQSIEVVWHTNSNLERLAETMIDFGHLVNSARQKELDEKFTTQIVKVTARIINLAKSNNINLEQAVINKIKKNELRGNRGRII